MAKIPSENAPELIRLILAARRWSRAALARELHVHPSRVFAWLAGGGIHEDNYAKLLALAPVADVETIRQPLRLPFALTIPRNTVTISTDKDGNIQIRGVMLALLDNKEG